MIIQYRVPDEQDQESQCDKTQPSDVGETSFRKDVAFSGLLLVRIRVVKPVVLFHIFWKQQKSSGW